MIKKKEINIPEADGRLQSVGIIMDGNGRWAKARGLSRNEGHKAGAKVIITMEYGQRLHVVLGTEENLAYKVQYMALAIGQMEEYETGELDVSFKYSDKALLNPEV